MHPLAFKCQKVLVAFELGCGINRYSSIQSVPCHQVLLTLQGTEEISQCILIVFVQFLFQKLLSDFQILLICHGIDFSA
jgi:hypothetical protein